VGVGERVCGEGLRVRVNDTVSLRLSALLLDQVPVPVQVRDTEGVYVHVRVPGDWVGE